MRNVKKKLEDIVSRMILVFPPETVFDGRCFCRYEPDGIALIKGFFKERGYNSVDLVYPASGPISEKEKEEYMKSPGWGISSFDQEGISFRDIVNAALKASITSSEAVMLTSMLPLDTIDSTSVIGFSVGFPSQLYHALLLGRIAKELNPDIFVAMGGPLISSYINHVATLKEMADGVDGIISGYGEEPLSRLLCCLEEKGDIKEVPNLYLKGDNGFRLNEASWKPDKKNLLTVPDYGRKTLKREFDPYFPVRPSIGCYWGKCAFCIYPSRATGAKTSKQTILKPRELVEHIRTLMENGSGKNFELCCDSLPPRYIKKFCEHIIQSKLDFKWNVWACVDRRFTDNGLLNLMKRAGCESALLGVESFCERTLKRMNKMQTREDIQRVVDAFLEEDIDLYLTLCIGFPGETPEEAMETINFLKDLIETRDGFNKDYVRIYRFALKLNSPIAENYRDYGISSVDWSEIRYVDDGFAYAYEVSEGMSFDEVKHFVLEWRSRLGIQTDDSMQTNPYERLDSFMQR